MSNAEHPLIPVLEKLVATRDNATFKAFGPRPLLLFAYGNLIPIQNYRESSDKPLCYHYSFESLWFNPDIDLENGLAIEKATDPNHKFETIFWHELSRDSW
ncbi:Protein of unknown function [Cotesia congregata]|uniref:Uncharacterized protein n=1 Tax=Cotesia congregata TaxID=51543 RepID=A0A8J2ECR9_COTCN|nr:Protein of unknown function [Cotesia congregata]